VRPGLRSDSSVVLVVSNAKVGMEAQYFVHHLGLHDVLRGKLFFVVNIFD